MSFGRDQGTEDYTALIPTPRIGKRARNQLRQLGQGGEVRLRKIFRHRRATLLQTRDLDAADKINQAALEPIWICPQGLN